MKRTIKLTHAAVAVVAALLVGAGGTYALLYRRHTQELLEVFLVERLAGLAQSANSLKLARSEEHERLATLLELDLDFNLSSAESLIVEGARLRGPAQNIRDGARRASLHYQATGRTDKQRQADMLFAKLRGDQE